MSCFCYRNASPHISSSQVNSKIIYVMHLLTLKRLTVHFTNPFFHVVLKHNVVSSTSRNFNFQKQKPRASKSAEFARLFRYNQRQFRRIEVPSLGHHMVYPSLSHPSYEQERTISHSKTCNSLIVILKTQFSHH